MNVPPKSITFEVIVSKNSKTKFFFAMSIHKWHLRNQIIFGINYLLILSIFLYLMILIIVYIWIAFLFYLLIFKFVFSFVLFILESHFTAPLLFAFSLWSKVLQFSDIAIFWRCQFLFQWESPEDQVCNADVPTQQLMLSHEILTFLLQDNFHRAVLLYVCLQMAVPSDQCFLQVI